MLFKIQKSQQQQIIANIQQVMFTEQLTNITVRSKSPQFKIPKQNNFSQSLDLHFQICTAFLKKTGQKLIQQQANIIDQSSKLLQNLQDNFKLNKKQTFYSNTDDSQDTPEDSYSYDSEEKIITRKNVSRRSQTNIQQALRQVEESCSSSTIGALTTLVSEFHKYQARIKNLQAKQHVIVKKQEAADKFHQQNIMLRNKLQVEQNRSRKFEEELSALKLKNQNISKCVEEKVNAIAMNQKVVDINQKVYRDIKAFLQDKQIHINSRLRKIEHIEQSIMIRIQNILSEPIQGQNPQNCGQNPCQRCCMMLKKLKQSILNYRNYLQHEAQEVQKLYNKHKKALFTFSSKGATSNKSLG